MTLRDRVVEAFARDMGGDFCDALRIYRAQRVWMAGSLVVPDEYLRLVDGFGPDSKTVQRGCSDIEWEDLLKELDARQDITDWMRRNVLIYKVTAMKVDAGL